MACLVDLCMFISALTGTDIAVCERKCADCACLFRGIVPVLGCVALQIETQHGCFFQV